MDNVGKAFRSKLLGKTQKSASMWKRFIALILDLIVINIFIVSPFKNILMKFIETTNIVSLDQTIPSYVYTTITCISIMALIYFAVFQSRMQQTIGMMIMNIHVTPEIGFWKAVARNLFILPFFPFSLLWIIEPLYLYYKGQRFLESITKTVTIENG